MMVVNTKAAEWEGLLQKKEEELRESRRRVSELEQQLRAASGSSDRRTVAKLTKVTTLMCWYSCVRTRTFELILLVELYW